MTKKSDEDSIHPSETAYDKAIKRMEEREAHIFNTPAMQIAADAAEQIRIQQAPLIQALQPLQDALQPYHNLIDQNSLGLVAASLSSVAQTIVPDNAVGSMTESLNVVATAIQPYQQDMNLFNSNVLAAFEAAAITPELRDFRTQFEVNVQEMGDGMSAISDYVNGLTSQWDNALGVANVLERSIAAQNLAMVRMLPCYSDLELPRGSKKVLRSLTKTTAKKLMQSDEIQFDPKEKDFYHKDSPESKLSADQITVVESSLELFAEFTLDELLSFESKLEQNFAFDLKKVPEDVDCKLYVKKNLEKAYGHEYRAFFDTADWLSYNLRKSIRERLRKMSKREKKEFIQRSGGEAFLERMNQYPFKVAEMRGDKDIGMASNDSPIREYQNILDEMIAIYKSIGE